MKNLLTQNADVLGLNSITFMISLTNVEQVMQIVLLSVSILYTIDKYIKNRNGKKNSK